MREHTGLFPIAASTTLAFVVCAVLVLSPDLVSAGEVQASPHKPSAQKSTPPKPSGAVEKSAPQPPATQPQSGEANCACPQQKEKLWSRPKFAELPTPPQRVVLDETDEIAALESVQFALTEVGDGASYIWHRNNGRLSGMVQPVTSFKDGQGQVCRHVVVILTTGAISKKTEGVACRLTSGQWKLEG
jgi:hypothetical protein